MHTVIFTGGQLRTGAAVTAALEAADLIFAADSGADAAIEFGRVPSVVVGDLDSISPQARQTLERAGAEFAVSPAEKDQTDTELAIACAVARGATTITVLGGLEGDRPDHVLANVLLMPRATVPVKFVSGDTTAWMQQGPAQVAISGHPGDTLSLIALTSKVTRIRSQNLHYDVAGRTLAMGQTLGISNLLTGPTAIVSFSRGNLLFVHTRLTVS